MSWPSAWLLATSMPASPSDAAVVPPPTSSTLRFETVWPVLSTSRI